MDIMLQWDWSPNTTTNNTSTNTNTNTNTNNTNNNYTGLLLTGNSTNDSAALAVCSPHSHIAYFSVCFRFWR